MFATQYYLQLSFIIIIISFTHCLCINVPISLRNSLCGGIRISKLIVLRQLSADSTKNAHRFRNLPIEIYFAAHQSYSFFFSLSSFFFFQRRHGATVCVSSSVRVISRPSEEAKSFDNSSRGRTSVPVFDVFCLPQTPTRRPCPEGLAARRRPCSARARSFSALFNSRRGARARALNGLNSFIGRSSRPPSNSLSTNRTRATRSLLFEYYSEEKKIRSFA